MHSYENLRKNHSKRVSQTIDSPIMVFDYFELGEVTVALLIVLFFGVIFYSWGLMFVLLALILGVVPIIRRKHEKGVFFHWPYKKFHMSLPGLVNPKGRRKYSD